MSVQRFFDCSTTTQLSVLAPLKWVSTFSVGPVRVITNTFLMRRNHLDRGYTTPSHLIDATLPYPQAYPNPALLDITSNNVVNSFQHLGYASPTIDELMRTRTAHREN